MTALKKRTFLMMESPTIAVVGGNSGRRDEDDEDVGGPGGKFVLAGGKATESR